ncbi:hypothetical protein ILUMI_12964 [Ignelater luminosus]|uniref:Uncharacterized protein n=1 Tax=Ignelater luminosus TaxID=2038154 RepID=A0A8K0CVE6_IGNLU|nr:hypothetical protein ILUMI_12964 [Ignelater luminosus]
MEKIKKMLKEMEKELKEGFQRLLAENQWYKDLIIEILNENKLLKHEIGRLKERMSHLEMKLEERDKEDKNKNIVIRGLEVEEKEASKSVEVLIKEKLEISANIEETDSNEMLNLQEGRKRLCGNSRGIALSDMVGRQDIEPNYKEIENSHAAEIIEKYHEEYLRYKILGSRTATHYHHSSASRRASRDQLPKLATRVYHTLVSSGSVSGLPEYRGVDYKNTRNFLDTFLDTQVKKLQFKIAVQFRGDMVTSALNHNDRRSVKGIHRAIRRNLGTNQEQDLQEKGVALVPSLPAATITEIIRLTARH